MRLWCNFNYGASPTNPYKFCRWLHSGNDFYRCPFSLRIEKNQNTKCLALITCPKSFSCLPRDMSKNCRLPYNTKNLSVCNSSKAPKKLFSHNFRGMFIIYGMWAGSFGNPYNSRKSPYFVTCPIPYFTQGFRKYQWYKIFAPSPEDSSEIFRPLRDMSENFRPHFDLKIKDNPKPFEYTRKHRISMIKENRPSLNFLPPPYRTRPETFAPPPSQASQNFRPHRS